MRKLALWIAAGLGLATVCGLTGLHHLSATLVTLTVFLVFPALLSLAHVWFLDVLWSLPDRVATWTGAPETITIGRNGDQ